MSKHGPLHNELPREHINRCGMVPQAEMDRLLEKQFTAAAQLRYRNKRGRWGVAEPECPLLRLQAG